jgi:hypothetical protein
MGQDCEKHIESDAGQVSIAALPSYGLLDWMAAMLVQPARSYFIPYVFL